MRIKRSPVQSLSASPELFAQDSPALFSIVYNNNSSGKRSRTGNDTLLPPLDLNADGYSDSDLYDSLSPTDGPRKRGKPSVLSAENKFEGLKAAKRFVQISVGLVGRNSARIPTHRELLQMGLTNALQVRARKFLVSVNGIAVNVRTRLCDEYRNLGELLDYLETLPEDKDKDDVVVNGKSDSCMMRWIFKRLCSRIPVYWIVGLVIQLLLILTFIKSTIDLNPKPAFERIRFGTNVHEQKENVKVPLNKVDEKIILTQKEKEVKVEQTVNNAKLVEHEDRMFIDQRFVDGIFSKKWDKNWDSYRRISSCYNGPRNFLTDPVLLIAPGLVNDRNADDCDVPCFHTNQQDANEVLRSDAMLGWDLGGSLNAEPRCPYQRKAHLSMESADYYSSNIIPDDAKDRHNLMMTTELRSNVTVGYYSWVDYGIMDPLDYERKTKSKAVGAAFISNCGDKSGRLDVLKGLIRNGVPIDSMGRCENNAREPAGRGKVDILRDYKFGMAFENTIWEDYVTEKLFQVFVSGAIPIVVGAPNSHDYEPLPETILYVKDFPTVEALASRVKEISNNETLFRHYLRYKTERPSDKFLALYDISAPHSRCRMCVKMADLYDEKHGEFNYGESHIQNRQDGITIRVRERYKYFFQDIFIPNSSLTISGLTTAILNAFKAVNHQPIWRGIRPKILDTASFQIFRIYKFHPHLTSWDTLKNDNIQIRTDKHVQSLSPNDRLEVILV